MQLTTNEYFKCVQHSSSITSNKVSKSDVVSKIIIEIPETIRNIGIFRCNGQSDAKVKPEILGKDITVNTMLQ